MRAISLRGELLMIKLLNAVVLTAATCSLGACATVTRGHDTAWEVKTVPPAASVKTSNGMQCDSTPCSLKIARNAEFDATITKSGYKPLKVHVTHKISGGGGAGMAGNVLLGGIIGAAVDVGTGAMYDLTPNPVDVVLEKEDGVAGSAPPQTVSASVAPSQSAPNSPGKSR